MTLLRASLQTLVRRLSFVGLLQAVAIGCTAAAQPPLDDEQCADWYYTTDGYYLSVDLGPDVSVAQLELERQIIGHIKETSRPGAQRPRQPIASREQLRAIVDRIAKYDPKTARALEACFRLQGHAY